MVTNKAERLARTLDLAEVTQFFNLSPQVQEQDQRAQNQEYQWVQTPKTTRSTDSTTMSIYPNIDSLLFYTI
ncbi:unnamed protein product [Rhizophagus irregularis]|nr:unnamed protein product [Rhizophagus irregularis]CAB5356937.1 unnamed protein product [Rhizophagus irregularis]